MGHCGIEGLNILIVSSVGLHSNEHILPRPRVILTCHSKFSKGFTRESGAICSQIDPGSVSPRRGQRRHLLVAFAAGALTVA